MKDRETVKEELKMKPKFWIVAAALLAVLVCGAVAFSYAQQPTADGTPGWRGHHGAHMGWMARELNLTDAQKEQAKAIMKSQHESMRPLMQQMAQNRKAMLEAGSGGAFDQAKVQAIANQQAQLMAQMMVQKASLQHQIYTQVLTTEQRAKADQMRQRQISRIDERLQRMTQPAAEAPQQ
jgi:periplasmic protein CpxP/Spy